jgi:competence protein ComFB
MLLQKETPDSPPVTYQYLNVMEYGVKERVKEYMEKFDVCPCGRCAADVTALALIHLPPKYIVVESAFVFPLLNFYSSRFSQQIVVELTKACTVVKENPHH